MQPKSHPPDGLFPCLPDHVHTGDHWHSIHLPGHRPQHRAACIHAADVEDALAAFLMSVRMIRAGFFAPVYMLVFWLVYHRWQKRDARL